jgi:squalene-hopene/tetraprenyl-beta-curcumene cyclase
LSTITAEILSQSEADKPLNDAIAAAAAALMRQQRADGHWVFELEADATIPSEYVLLVHYLGEAPNPDLERKIGAYLRRIRGTHGGWPLYHDGPFDLSATVKAYFALKMIGDSPEEPHMKEAREAILAHGGAYRVNVFTRFLLALYGEIPWKTVPTIPAELILAPRWFPVHLTKMSYWARTVLVPLLVLQVLKPKARNPRGIHVLELCPTGQSFVLRRAGHQNRHWAAFFMGLDRVLKLVDPIWPRKLRTRAIGACVAFVSERLNGEDGLGAIYPAIANSVMMYDALGYPAEHPERTLARTAIEKLLIVKSDEAYCQPCVSPVWDTALLCHALMEAGGAESKSSVGRALQWLAERQVLDVEGDWAVARPQTRPGGWAFQYNNAYYPDLDDTAVVVMAFDRARKGFLPSFECDAAIARGLEWVTGLQSKNGGFAAFDADNTYHYLNNIPFADHGALLDPPTADVTGRCIGMLAQLGAQNNDPKLSDSINYLKALQGPDGSWFGRWGVNYVYGTWSALAALDAVQLGSGDLPVNRAAKWLIAIQNADGGWGEDCDSYRLDYNGYRPAPSTASQTSWALLGLMAAGQIDHEAVARGVAYLLRTQRADGLWLQEHYTGGGFPRVFYLRYHGYPKFFPLWALARYRNLKAGSARRVKYGL